MTFAIVCLASNARAQVSGHSNPVLKLVQGGKAFKLTLRLTDHNGFKMARVGLIKREHATSSLTRPQAVQPGLGILLHQFPAETGFAQGEAREVEWTVEFNEKLQRGAKLSIVSAWGDSNDSPHVFGGVTQNAEEASSFIELP